MKRPLKSFALCVLLALLACGCATVGPDYKEPTAPVMPDYLEYEDPNLDTAVPAEPEWWKRAFNDPILDHLVETALAQNLSLRSAGLRVLQARQQLAIAIGNQYPQQQQFSGQAGVGGNFASSDYEVYDLGFNLAWEVDVWGRFKRQIESASAALDASVGSYDGIMVSLIAEVARTYLLIRTTQQRLVVARNNLELQKESMRITTAKYEGGESSSLDVEQAQTLYYITTASVPSLEQSLQQLKNSLAILLGRPPHDMSKLLGEVQPVPTVTAEIAVGMPQDLIRRRPDLRTAERRLAAQSAQIGFAVSELYPHFGLGGSIGTSVSTNAGLSFNDLFSAETIAYNLFGAFTWNIFQYGRLKNNIRLQDAIFQQLLEDYRQTVLQAQSEVENAIVAFFKTRQQLEAIRLAAEAAKRATDVSTVQYEEGEVPFNTVITTLQALISQQDALAATQGSVATNLVAVFKSLGGGWEVRQSQDPLDLIPEQTRKEMLERTKYWNKTFKDE
jgi:NodT family efflux transporter outer membrane factor (OMF) lipoprotein